MSAHAHSSLKLHHFSAYGLASVGKVAVEMLLQLYLFDLYTRLLGLSPILAGSAFAVAIVWDAVSDVIVAAGLLYARKHKFLYTTAMCFGAIILAIATWALFAVNAGGSQLQLFLQLLFSYVFINTGMTLIDLPQTSLSSELSPHSNDRNKLLGFRLGMGIFGLAIGSALPGLLLVMMDDNSNSAVIMARANSGAILAVTVFVTCVLSAIGLRSADRRSTQMRHIEMPDFREALPLLKQRAFRQLIYASLVAAVGRTINAALALMYYRLVLNLSEEIITGVVFPVFSFSIVLSIPLWTQLSKYYGKLRPAYLSAGALGLAGILVYPVLPEGLVWPVLVVAVMGGALCGSVFLMESIITDLIDQDEKESGRRKESLFFAIQKSTVKISRALAFIFISGWLQFSGINVAEAASVGQFGEWVIVGLFGIVVGACFIAAGYYLWRAEMVMSQKRTLQATL